MTFHISKNVELGIKLCTLEKHVTSLPPLQGLKMESQQLQFQLQRVQQEEMETKPDGTAPTDQQQPRKSDQIRRRLMEIDHNMKQVCLINFCKKQRKYK